MLEGCEIRKRSLKLYKILAISTNIAGVNFCHSTISVGESLEPILIKLLQESCRLILNIAAFNVR